MAAAPAVFYSLLLTACGDTAAEQVTAPVEVATVRLSAATTRLVVGQSVQLTAAALDAVGAEISGMPLAWTSNDDRVIRVDSTGMATAVGEGTVTVVASVEGHVGQVVLTVEWAPVVVAPAFAALGVGETLGLRAEAGGTPVLWSSGAPGVAEVSAGGLVTGRAPGVAEIVARGGSREDTALVAVLGARDPLATAFPGGSARLDVRAGQVVAVPVALDLSRVGADGDLGALQFELGFDEAVLRYDSVHVALTGSADTHRPTPGRLRYAFAATGKQGQAQLTLATVYFTVAADAAAGTLRSLSLGFPTTLTDTQLRALAAPVAVDGRIRVVAP